ncbi:MAG: hypothetical protein HFF62_04110 [Oscillospiraceae bacterium]|nr:hypothetical protein [Oscillospiraceae bacterium]
MTPELMEEAVVNLAILTGYLLVLGVGCLIADFVFPHIPFIERYLESLPDWEDEDEEGSESMPERAWKLGEDLLTCDSLLDGLTFDDLILAVHCNCKEITREAVHTELNEILESRKQDLMFLLENNMEAIIEEAKKGREA